MPHSRASPEWWLSLREDQGGPAQAHPGEERILTCRGCAAVRCTGGSWWDGDSYHQQADAPPKTGTLHDHAGCVDLVHGALVRAEPLPHYPQRDPHPPPDPTAHLRPGPPVAPHTALPAHLP